jgi:phage tail-like protein
MSFNLEYLYNHLPGYMRQDDEETLLLKRFLSFFGETLDAWDAIFENFFEQIAPGTASEEFIKWWLYALFDWSWFPHWFALADLRQLYANIGRHYARRGTARGIELWLRDFGITARVWSRPLIWGEFLWGETAYGVNEPLHLIIEILAVQDRVNLDAVLYGESLYGEGLMFDSEPTLTDAEIIGLIRFMQPVSQEIVWGWRVHPAADVEGSDFLLLM